MSSRASQPSQVCRPARSRPSLSGAESGRRRRYMLRYNVWSDYGPFEVVGRRRLRSSSSRSARCQARRSRPARRSGGRCRFGQRTVPVREESHHPRNTVSGAPRAPTSSGGRRRGSTTSATRVRSRLPEGAAGVAGRVRREARCGCLLEQSRPPEGAEQCRLGSRRRQPDRQRGPHARRRRGGGGHHRRPLEQRLQRLRERRAGQPAPHHCLRQAEGDRRLRGLTTASSTSRTSRRASTSASPSP